MPRPRYENMDPEKKARLVEAATREFATHGYELASVNRILEAAELSKGSFYYYFDDKVDLAATVFLEAAEPDVMLSELGTPRTAEEFWAELRRVNLERLRRLESRRVQYDCVSRLGHAFTTEPRLAAAVMPRFAGSARRFEAFMERGVAVGALRSDLPVPMLLALVESMKTTTYRITFADGRVPREAELEAFSEQVMDLFHRIAHPKFP